MYTTEALADILERSQRSLVKMMGHCAALPQAEFDRELAGFGYPTVRLQLHHVIGAEEYWVGVLQGRVEADMDDAGFPTVAALDTYRERVSAATRSWLAAVSAAELNRARPMLTWGDREQVLVPARVILRTQTHIYQHLGQVVAMCRMLGRPAEGMDFPLL